MSMASKHCTSIKATYADYSKTRRRPHRKTTLPKIVVAATNTNKVMVFLSLLAILCMNTLATAQQECSCAPREYKFRLDFSGTCPPETKPPNDYFGPGVEEYTCSIGDSPVQDRIGEQDSDPRHLTQLVDLFPELQISTQNIADQIPVIISSIQFIQQDQAGNPIESTLKTEDKTDGETVRFASSIIDKPDQIPYRITMVLRGFNAGQQAIQNTFTIEFTNTCGVPTFIEGEQIGWVIFDELKPASQNTCPIAQPIPQPSMSYSTSYSMSYYPSSASEYSSKGSKKSSKSTSSKSGKSKSSKSKSGKSGKSKSSKSKQGKRNLQALRTIEESNVKELRREQRTNKYQKRYESVNRHLRRRI